MYPVTGQTVLAILNALMEGEHKRIYAMKLQLHRENAALLKFDSSAYNGFTYLGEFFRIDNSKPYTSNSPTLVASLHGKADEMVAAQKEVNTDTQFLHQMLFNLMRPAKDLQGVRDALPDCVAENIPELAHIPRVDEEAHTIKKDVRSMRQYNRILPKFQLYAATRLFY